MKTFESRGALLALALAVTCGTSVSLADPLNPLDFTSLGDTSVAPGVYTIDTDAATLTGPSTNIPGQILANRTVVFCFGNILVSSDVTFNIVGSRPVAILSTGNFTMAADVNASGANASGTSPGAGRGTSGNGAQNGPKGNPGYGIVGGLAALNCGGSGGSFGAIGGRGGGNAISPPNSYGNLLRFVEGGSGGAGGSDASGTSGGAGGGGAAGLEIGALGTLNVSGAVINMKGGNGSAGTNAAGATPSGGHGGGGGSGGGLLLHGATVILGGTIDCSGGAGGAGGNGSGAAGGNGGGGGSGGRVSIQSVSPPVVSNITVAGGTSGAGGTGSSSGTAGLSGGAGNIVNVAGVLTPMTLDFGSVEVGTSKVLAMEVGNTGGANSSINGRFPTAAAPFARIGTGVFSALRRDRSTCNEYSFSPTTSGPFQQTLTFVSDGGNSTVIIKGYGYCRSDLNNDLFVDDADFTLFADDYNTLLCP